MATTPTSTDRQNAARFDGLEPEALIRAFRIMHTARRLDDREITLKRQNRIFFQISGAGHEAIQVAAGMVLRPGYDWVYPYYRDRALCLALGVTPYYMLLQAVGAASDPASYRTIREAAAYCRSGHGPALVHAHVVRLYSHSLSDDERMYKTAAERKVESERDPVLNFPKLLVDEGILDRHALQRIVHEIDEEIHEATQEALRQEPPARDSALVNLYSDRVDPASDAFEATA